MLMRFKHFLISDTSESQHFFFRQKKGKKIIGDFTVFPNWVGYVMLGFRGVT